MDAPEASTRPAGGATRPPTLVVIPTYNEAANIEALVGELLALDPELEVLVVDDNSPDGTAERVRALGAREPRVHLLLREGPRGRGLAGVEGFRWALARGAGRVVEMDGDRSHRPRDLPLLLKALEGADLVVGSRLVRGGSQRGQNLPRLLASRLANFLVRSLLRLPVRDCTSGFRCYRREVLEAIGLDRLTSRGPSVVEETLYAAHLLGFRAVEVPILYEARGGGESKLRLRVLLETLLQVVRFRLTLSRMKATGPRRGP